MLFEVGRLVHASFGGRTGEDAFAALIQISQRESQAAFRFDQMGRAELASLPKTISRSVDQLLLSIAAGIDEGGTGTEPVQPVAVTIRKKGDSMAKVLVVDDSVSVRTVVERALRSKRIEVLSAASGTEAMAQIRSEEPDLVVCDVIMPDMEGYELCEFVRGHPRLAATPVLLMAGIVNGSVLGAGRSSALQRRDPEAFRGR